ncbi:hypothetical protein JOM56_012240 [Amanita muscaria]
MVSSPTWPDRAKQQSNPDAESTKKPPVNYWNAKVAAAAAATHTSASQSTTSDSSIAADNDDDAFVVRVPPNRERNPIAIPTLDDAEAWPEVGKSSAIKSNKEKDVEHSQQLGTGSKKNEKKWIPLPADEWQPAPEHRPRPHAIKNGPSQPSTQSKNMSAINGSKTRSRAQSGHNSVSQSTTQSRINSRSGSVHSSPRFPRNKRLPPDDAPVGPQPQSDMQASESGHVPIAYPTPLYTPDNPLASYYSRQPPFTSHQHFRHTSAHSPSNPNTPPLYQPPPPMHYSNAAAPYPIYPQYAPYDYGMTSPQSSFLYWNNPLHHSASGEPPLSYSTSSAHYPSHSPHPQPLRASQPGPIHHYPDRPDDQSYTQQSSRVPLPPEQSQAVAGYVPITLDSDSSQREPMTFGSIAAPGSPCPPDDPADEKVVSQLEAVERALTMFSIGMSEDDKGCARFRSRKRPVKTPSRSSLTGSTHSAEVKVVDLTDKETKWKFGFADGELSPASRPEELLPPSGAGATTPGTQVSSLAATPLSSISASLPFEVPLNSSLPSAPTNTGTEDSDPFKVKDYGYGFGTGKNPGPARPSRERRDRGERDHAEREGNDDGDGDGERSYNRQRRPYDRGGYSGRRGGRGGTNGYPRGPNRGYHGGGGMQPHRPPPHPASQIPPTGPHSQFPPPILPMAEHPNGYYPHNQVPPFIPQPYDAYPPQFSPAPGPLSPVMPTPPMPPPRSELPFPLDTTRYWLLGQLEYYLSPQNLAQDFYLRQQMDAKGWIPIATLASFNRVRNLTLDYQTVKDVLILSTVLMVKDDWVRMLGWESFVLPNAPASTVEQLDTPMTIQHVERDESPAETQPKADAEAEEEEEEEDVVFVMGKETGWSPQHRT